MDNKDTSKSTIGRRGFLTTAAAAGATVILGGRATGASGADAPAVKPKRPRKGPSDELNVGIIGTGAEGQVLINACMYKHAPIPGLNFVAMCDIWSYNKKYVKGKLKKSYYRKFPDVKDFEDYQEMLDDDSLDLDCVIVATPEWKHAEHSIECMKKGIHVYCEKEMSNDLNEAREMVKVSNEKDVLLQIGHQRRSNPRYIHAVNNLVRNKDVNILGRVTQAMAQWNRGVSADIGWPRTYVMPSDKLTKYGYDTMHRFRNWRWYKRYGGGPIVDLGSHQIDIFEWVFGTHPKSVYATGGVDYYDTHEWYDNVMCLYEYETEPGKTSRAFYQVQTTTSHGGYHEVFMGENGTLVMSENPMQGNWVKRETRKEVPDWNQYVKQGLIQEIAQKIPKAVVKSTKAILDVRTSPSLPKWPLPVDLARPPHQPHLANFFEAVRLGDKGHLNCPGEIGFKTAVAVLAVNNVIETQQKRVFDEKEFHA